MCAITRGSKRMKVGMEVGVGVCESANVLVDDFEEGEKCSLCSLQCYGTLESCSAMMKMQKNRYGHERIATKMKAIEVHLPTVLLSFSLSF